MQQLRLKSKKQLIGLSLKYFHLLSDKQKANNNL